MGLFAEASFDTEARGQLLALSKRFRKEKFLQGLTKVLEKHAERAERFAKRRAPRRTGRFAESIQGLVVKTQGLPQVRLGVFDEPMASRAAALEFGAEILPRRANALAIPVGKALNADGLPKYRGPRQYPAKLVFLRKRSGGDVLGVFVVASDLRRRGSKAEAVFIVVKRSVVKGRGFLAKAVEDVIPGMMEGIGAFVEGFIEA